MLNFVISSHEDQRYKEDQVEVLGFLRKVVDENLQTFSYGIGITNFLAH